MGYALEQYAEVDDYDFERMQGELRIWERVIAREDTTLSQAKWSLQYETNRLAEYEIQPVPSDEIGSQQHWHHITWYCKGIVDAKKVVEESQEKLDYYRAERKKIVDALAGRDDLR